jgi:protein-arginine kinase activator protein McsA
LSAKLAELEKALKQAVAAEAFEEAARLRDEIETCRREADKAPEEESS